MRILLACETSNITSNEFRKLGHYVLSCDILPNDESQVNHYKGNVLDIINDDWDMMIAHPPCTYLCNSGVHWLNKKAGRWDDMKNGADFFKQLLNANIPKICIENPISHKYAIEIIGRKYDQIIQPWMFGDGETKATCLWLKGLKKLYYTKETNLFWEKTVSDGRDNRIARMFPSENRWKERSKTFKGIAMAFANQWGAEL